jgi:hypothetical protein
VPKKKLDWPKKTPSRKRLSGSNRIRRITGDPRK